VGERLSGERQALDHHEHAERPAEDPDQDRSPEGPGDQIELPGLGDLVEQHGGRP
jgi:hypothetical protein